MALDKKALRDRRTLALAVLLIAAIVPALYNTLNQTDARKKRSLQNVVSGVLGVSVNIGDMSTIGRTVFIEDLKVLNPIGYFVPVVLVADRIEVSIELIDEHLLVFDRIEVEGVRVDLELASDGTNVTTIRSFAKRRASAISDNVLSNPVNVVIRKLTINGMTVNPEEVFAKDLSPVESPPFDVGDIGVERQGIPAQDAIFHVVDHMAQQIIRQAAGAGFLKGMRRRTLEDIRGQLGIDMDIPGSEPSGKR